MIDVSPGACANIPKLTRMQRFACDGLRGFTYLEFDCRADAEDAAITLWQRHPELHRILVEGTRVKLTV